MVKSKDYHIKLYKDLHQNNQAKTLKNYKDLHKALQGLGWKKIIIGNYASPPSL